MAKIDFSLIDKKWQKYWQDKKTFAVIDDEAGNKNFSDAKFSKPKYYILDMFPYPSGAGLHVGHPLGYIASDILARVKRMQGYNVLHPMGFDSFGLPAEQYAIQTGQHPAVTTKNNIKRYREQLDAIGLSFDWDRQVSTCEPQYYKHTQKVFLKLFDAWYCKKTQRARPLVELKEIFAQSGNVGVVAATHCEIQFSAKEWLQFSAIEQDEILHAYRLAYRADSWVNWCPKLGTVLANDEVKDGLSARGGYPVVQKKMKQWQLRITAYAERLLAGLSKIDWPEAVKDMQRNWIGKSSGAEIFFKVQNSALVDLSIKVFTTRPDTIFGVSALVLAPEHEYVNELTSDAQKMAVAQYVDWVSRRSERERMTDAKKCTGVFLGSYAQHPFTGKLIPIWISDYVLSTYGTGAVMSVPAHDERDFLFAQTFSLPILAVIQADGAPSAGGGPDILEHAYEAKSGKMINSDFLNGLDVSVAINCMIDEIVKRNLGVATVNYKLRDVTFSRQRYWGEPIPIYYKDGIACALSDEELPLQLPAIDKYLPTETGDPPLARAGKQWQNREGYPLEYSTMPGFAGSCAYYLRYMDPFNDAEVVSKIKNDYWDQVDFYLGGSEHATGHLLYARFWNLFLFDLGIVKSEEPFKKLFNQGMILGRSNFVYRIKGTNKFVTKSKIDQYETQMLHVNVALVKNDLLDTARFKAWLPEYQDAEFILNEAGDYECGYAIEKMSKSFYNVINPEEIISEYGADAFRLYEMFLGPLEQSKPWITSGLEGVVRFLNKFWRLYFDEEQHAKVNLKETVVASKEELKVLHLAIQKVTSDVENISLNTCVSNFMIAVNEFTRLQTTSRAVLEPFLVLISAFIPHLAEEIWSEVFGYQESIAYAPFPVFDPSLVVADEFEYAISFNGKMRFTMKMAASLSSGEIEQLVLAHEQTKKWLQGSAIKKVIVVPKKIVNIVMAG